ncbi:type I restriction endonuclease subunit M [Thiomicrospira sp. XS5]|uniref:type I restriction-modification system subunit M n=1 Tax=Thiomicrospira sp. XS5 TaxID=1775636 RepID=UPI000749C8A1|nr:type I restriction-modification system subunit M [Thiomicrospira sp. XS5]KUJ74542.1 type I restriction endonuclease subunit M [Thiomicrospira sp. XS5]
MNKQQLAAKIWESANQMRSKIEANEYKDYILGFMFYKYLSDQTVAFAEKQGLSGEDLKQLTEDDEETVEYFKSNMGYFIAYDNLFSTWIAQGKDFEVANVRNALSAFNRLINAKHKKLFDGIFTTLETGLSKLGDTAQKQTKAISQLIHLIQDIPTDGRQGYDVLGFVYEYLISMFAANAGKKAGEFYTPHEISVLKSELIAHHLKDNDEIKIFDPCSGSGSLLINIGESVAKHIDDKNNIQYYAQELKENTYNLTRMNLIMRGILVENITTRNGDTLEDDWPYFDESDPEGTYDPLYVDAVVSNPPYSQSWDPAHKEADPRYAKFGLAPKTKADFAFLLHDLYHLKPKGIMTIVLPHGVLFRGGDEAEIRKNLIEANHIDAIIGLPANIFFGTGIPTIIIVLKKTRDNEDVLIVDASKHFTKVGKNNLLKASDIKRIVDTVVERKSVDKFSRKVTRQEIRDNGYNLNIPRYVDSSEPSESWDIYASMFGGIPKHEIDTLNHFWQAFPSLRNALFENADDAYTQVKVDNIKTSITAHEDIQAFKATFNQAFADFHDYLTSQLIDGMSTLKITRQETILGKELFQRLAQVEPENSLIDKYEAYQLLDDEWQLIAPDLEMIQTEGVSTIKVVEPNLVIKKKNGKDHEVQEGWKGRILPFELVQKALLPTEVEKIEALESRLAEVSSELESAFESLNEEDKERDAVNEGQTAFVAAGVKKEAKQVKADIKAGETYPDDSYEIIVVKVEALMAEEKAKKAELKKEAAALHLLTKETIEKLSDEQANELVELKWIKPLVDSINQLPDNLINSLANKVTALAEKYATTYKEVVEQIDETQQALSEMIDDLEGGEFDMAGLAEFQALLKGNV